jgi:multidrug efflux pump subunit AcrA (membrane-fusion protein)
VRTVLVVDHDPEFRCGLENALGPLGWKPAVVTVPALPGDTLRGRVARTAGSLDASARTLLTEVQVANPGGVFLPGMYADVRLALNQGTGGGAATSPGHGTRDPSGPPASRNRGTRFDGSIPDDLDRPRSRELGGGNGGLPEGAHVVLNPTDDLRDGARVRIASVPGSSQ